jgi:arginyl-tRNA synthetase
MALPQVLEQVMAQAFAAAGLDETFAKVQRSDRPDLCDYQCNGAFLIAKQNKENPRAVAEKVVPHIQSPLLEKVELAGPGFINLTVTHAALAEAATTMLHDARFTVPTTPEPKTFMDYGGPNVAKEMHVGHLRTAIIGEALKRVLRFVNGESLSDVEKSAVISDVHLGDWGKPMGMLMAELKREQPDLPYFDEAKTSDFPQECPLNIQELSALYRQASSRCKEDEVADEAARVMTHKIQSGTPGLRALLEHFHDVSIADVKKNYALMNVDFDLWMGESSVQGLVLEQEQLLQEKGILVESDGALIIHVGEDAFGNAMPPLIYRTKNGSHTYAATDFATIIYRINHGAKRVLYIVDARQALHFRQVFAAVHMAGHKVDLIHLPNGTINGKDGKPFKTRTGGAMRLRELLDMASGLARQQLPEQADGINLDQLADQVAVAAIKFQDLKNNLRSDYIFDEEQFMRFEGKTGPYLQYAVARTNALLAKAQAAGVNAGAIHITAVEEKNLLIEIFQFPSILARAAKNFEPSIVAEHAYTLAQAYSTFYANCPVMTAEEDVKQARLSLALLTQKMLQLELDLLGIESPDVMLKKEDA